MQKNDHYHAVHYGEHQQNTHNVHKEQGIEQCPYAGLQQDLESYDLHQDASQFPKAVYDTLFAWLSPKGEIEHGKNQKAQGHSIKHTRCQPQ